MQLWPVRINQDRSALRTINPRASTKQDSRLAGMGLLNSSATVAPAASNPQVIALDPMGIGDHELLTWFGVRLARFTYPAAPRLGRSTR